MGLLAVIDYALSSAAIFAPDFYMTTMHSHPPHADYFMLQRTGVVWLVFAVCQTIAFINPQRFHLFVLAVGAFRLMEVPADPVYLLTSKHLTPFGMLGLISAPLFNLVVGLFLIQTWRKNFNEKT